MKRVFIKMILFYQKHISSVTKPSCKFYPTCSNYAIEALTIHGFFKGSLMAGYRVLRCNPFSKGGFDPVPAKKIK